MWKEILYAAFSNPPFFPIIRVSVNGGQVLTSTSKAVFWNLSQDFDSTNFHLCGRKPKTKGSFFISNCCIRALKLLTRAFACSPGLTKNFLRRFPRVFPKKKLILIHQYSQKEFDF